MTMNHVRSVEAAKEAFEKEAKEAMKRRVHAASNKSTNPETVAPRIFPLYADSVSLPQL